MWNVLKGTCNYDNYLNTKDEHSIWWFSGGSFFHFERGEDEEEDEGAKVVLWLSEGFWFLVEGKGVEIIMAEGWDSMVSIREVEDSIVEVDDKEVMGKGLMKIGDGLWDFKFNLEDWHTPKGWNREGIMMEICKGLRWVWGKTTREWSVEEIIGWERYWEWREDMCMEVSNNMEVRERDGKTENDSAGNNNKEVGIGKQNVNDKVEINNDDDGSKRDGKYNDNKDNEGNNKKEENKKQNKRRQRKGVREENVCQGEKKPTTTMRWEARRRRGKIKAGDVVEALKKGGSDIASGVAVQPASGEDNGEQTGGEMRWAASGVCELEWDGLDQRYVKKRRKKIEGGPVNSAFREVELAIGASTEARRQVGCEVARGDVRAGWTGMDLGAELSVDGAFVEVKSQTGCEVMSGNAQGGGRANDELRTGLEQGAEPIARMHKERECTGAEEDEKGRGDREMGGYE